MSRKRKIRKKEIVAFIFVQRKAKPWRGNVSSNYWFLIKDLTFHLTIKRKKERDHRFSSGKKRFVDQSEFDTRIFLFSDSSGKKSIEKKDFFRNKTKQNEKETFHRCKEKFCFYLLMSIQLVSNDQNHSYRSIIVLTSIIRYRKTKQKSKSTKERVFFYFEIVCLFKIIKERKTHLFLFISQRTIEQCYCTNRSISIDARLFESCSLLITHQNKFCHDIVRQLIRRNGEKNK